MSDSKLLNFVRGLVGANSSLERENEALKAERDQHKANCAIYKERVKNLLSEKVEMAKMIEKLQTFRDAIRDIHTNHEKEMATQEKESERKAGGSTPPEASTQGPEPTKNPKPYIRK